MGSVGAEVEGDNRCHPVCSIALFVNISWKGIYSGGKEKIGVEARGSILLLCGKIIGVSRKNKRTCVEENN